MPHRECRGAERPGSVARTARRWLSAALAALAFGGAALGGVALAPARLLAQEAPSRSLLRRVLPAATRFGELEGDPPVVRGYATDPRTGEETFVGLAFLTSDVPPEELGYNGPIDVLVGMDPTGELTGIVVVDYYESLRGSRGDFLSRQGFQEQFTGKGVTEAFRVGRDIDGISGATITVAAMSRGVRNAARRVWSAYMLEAEAATAVPATPGADELERLSWLELAARGMLQKMMVQDEGVTRIAISLLRVRDEKAGRALLGDGFEEALEEAGARAAGRELWFIGIDGALAALFRPQALFVIQDGDTLRLESEDAVLLGEPRDGKADAQFRDAGLLLLQPSIDARRAFTFLADFNNGWGAFTARYPGVVVAKVADAGADGDEEPSRDSSRDPASAPQGEPARTTSVDDAAVPPARERAPSPPGAADSIVAGGTPPLASAALDPGAGPLDAAVGPFNSPVAGPPGSPAGASDTTRSGGERASGDISSAATPSSGPGAGAAPALTFAAADSDRSVLARTLARTSWLRVAGLAGLLALVCLAFALKRAWLRGIVLAATLLYLGFGGGGFLSVSHLVAAIEVGPALFLEDLPLLLLVSFTVVTTLLWGRVFCGYLCPFGALQDAIERVVPRRFRREPPAWLHERALLVKYGVLALVLLPALAGSHATIYHWVEPFGTVFFLSTSAVLWGIALAFLLASAIIPRFYCRYVCPLGASLALTSLLSPLRIRRVEQCTVCTVCENACPTGAIRRERIDFKECVRCNVCESALEERVGVCRHDMDEVRLRLVQIEAGAGVGGR